MAELSRQEMEKLILGYEDLSAQDRAVADAVLNRHPDLAARLKWNQQKEGASGRELPIAEAAWTESPLSATEEIAQQESLRRILAQLDSGSATTSQFIGFNGRLRRQARWALPLAAILAVVAFLPIGPSDDLLLSDLTSTQLALAPGGTRGPDDTETRAGVLRTGQAFALDFTLHEDAFVVIFHVDPVGRIMRVFPEDESAGPVRLAGGRQHRVPSLESGEMWVLGPETGTESFLVASSGRSAERLGEFPIPASGESREATLNTLRDELESYADQVDLHEFVHVE